VRKKGYGIGCIFYGIGNTGTPNPAGAFVDILEDGTAVVLTGCADIGQGSGTVLAQIAPETLGIDVGDVAVISADTGVTPDAGATSASRQTYISGNAVLLAAREARQQLLGSAARLLGTGAETLDMREGRIYAGGQPTAMTLAELKEKCRAEGTLFLGQGYFNPSTTPLSGDTGQGTPYATYAFATQVAEVEVDTATGLVEVKKIVAAHDVGTAVNPQSVEGQIEGACAMGVDSALLEEMVVQDGAVQNPHMAAYLIPTALDVPLVYPVIVEESEPSGPYGAKGVGEPALVPTAAAVANAVADALGVRFYDLPFTPEKIVAAVKAGEEPPGKPGA